MADSRKFERRREFSERLERSLQLPMVILSMVFLVTVALPELVQLSDEALLTLDTIDWLIWAIFAFELSVMTYLAPDRLQYLRRHWADVLIVLLPFLRPFRLLRIAIIVAQFWADIRILIYQRTFSAIAMASLLSCVAAAILVYAVERGGEGPIQTFPDALWWAAATITTVGYGDVYPKTAAGRGIAFLLMLVGISVFGVLTARVAAFFVGTNTDDTSAKLDEMLARLDRIERELRQTTDRSARDVPGTRQAARRPSTISRQDDSPSHGPLS